MVINACRLDEEMFCDSKISNVGAKQHLNLQFFRFNRVLKKVLQLTCILCLFNYT